MDTALHAYADYASFLLTFSAILFLLVLLYYCSLKARGWKKFAEEKLAMVQLQVKRLHQAEYTYDPSTGGQYEVTEELVAAFLYLGIGCDAIYHPEKGNWSGEARRVSEDGRISDEKVDNGRIRVITVRGTKDLEDILWDMDIKGISPGDDLFNDSKVLSTSLIRLFRKEIALTDPQDALTDPREALTDPRDALTDLRDRLAGIMTSNFEEKGETMQVSSGSWIAAKNILRHVVDLKDYNPRTQSMIITGHSLGGGAASLATLVLSCLCDMDDCYKAVDLVCVSFGQPRVLVAPCIGWGRSARVGRKEDIPHESSEYCNIDKQDEVPPHLRRN